MTSDSTADRPALRPCAAPTRGEGASPARFAGAADVAPVARRGARLLLACVLLGGGSMAAAQQAPADPAGAAPGVTTVPGATSAADPNAPAADVGAPPEDAVPGPATGLHRVPKGVAEAPDGSGSTYPTVALADYVFGCMAANGNTYDALQECSCSIDYIRTRMDWDAYEKANTIMQIQLDRGQRGTFYRDSNWAKSSVDRLQELQAESSLRCF